MTKYQIYIVNNSVSSQTFWCFLEQPISEVSSEVYANSSAFLTVGPYNPSKTDSFTIPLQYKVAADASNQAVGLNTVVQSSFQADTDLGQAWLTTYTQDGTNTGPIITEAGSTAADQVDVTTNNYDKAQEPVNQWYASMTFGVESENGFIGQTWSPDPSTTYEIRPNVVFYVATGSYSSNELADITQISSTAATITNDDFDGAFKCTVTLNSDGTWTVAPGSPNSMAAIMHTMSQAHLSLASAHANLTQLLVTEA